MTLQLYQYFAYYTLLSIIPGLVTWGVFTLTTFFTYKNFGPFLSGQWQFHHDSLSSYPSFHLFYESLFRGQIPLWNPYQNAGEPLWLSTEALQTWDPVAMIVFGITSLLKTDSMLAYEITCIGWLALFAWGGMLCSKQIYSNPKIQLSIYSLLFVGPIAHSIPAGSPAFLLPFRYLPLLFYALGEYFQDPTPKKAILTGAIAVFACANYQSFFYLPALFVFVSIHLIGYRSKIKETLKYLPYLFLITLMGWCPTLLSWIEMHNVIAVPRTYFSFQFILRNAFLFFGMIDFKNILDMSHGSGKVGLSVMAALTLVLSLLPWKAYPKRTTDLAWLGVALISLITCSDFIRPWLESDQKLLGLRNWGDTVTLLVLSLTQMIAIGARLLAEEKILLRPLLVFSLPLALFLLLFSHQALWVQTQTGNNYIPVTNLVFPLAAALLLVFLKEAFLLLLVGIDTLFLFSPTLSHIERSSSAPALTWSSPPTLAEHREWDFPLETFAPFHVQGPGIHRRWNAQLPPLSQKSKYYALTHLFRVKTFDKLLQSKPETELRKILGVDTPLIRWKDTHSTEGISPISFHENRLGLQVQTVSPRILIYSDNDTQDWKTYIDGRLQPKRNEEGMKAVLVEPGSHQVIFQYQPVLYLVMFWIRGLLTASLSAYIFLRMFRKFPLSPTTTDVMAPTPEFHKELT